MTTITTMLTSNIPIVDKIEQLRIFSTTPAFLEVLSQPSEFLDALVPFAQKFFKEVPPDSAHTFGQTNELRVFLIRLLSKFRYENYDARAILSIAYDLLQNDNIFNRYLTLKILFPLLESKNYLYFDESSGENNVAVTHVNEEIRIHLGMINSFFKKELPSFENPDNTLCELGFFTAAEALNYLKEFQVKYKLNKGAYEEIFISIAETLKKYFMQSYLEKYLQNKKIICEFCSMTIKLLDFVNVFADVETQKGIGSDIPIFFTSFIPDLCFTLYNTVPFDCYSLMNSALATIASCIQSRKEIFYNLERYLMKSTYRLVDNSSAAADSIATRIYTIEFLSEILIIFSRGMSSICFNEFDLRIKEMLPLNRNVKLLHACSKAFVLNTSLLLNYPMDLMEMKLLVQKQIKNAYKIYNLLHCESEYSAPIKSTFCSSELSGISRRESADAKKEAVSVLYESFLDYIKIIIKAMVGTKLAPIEQDDAYILSKLLMFPLTREMNLKDHFVSFNELPVDDLERIAVLAADDIILRYFDKSYAWSPLLATPEINFIFIKAANMIIHEDFMSSCYKSFNFYQRVLPVAYGYFKMDKKYAKNEFSEYLSVIFDCILRFQETHADEANLCSYDESCEINISIKQMISLIDNMFLDVKSCEIAYTGLYFIYNNFEKTVNELYNLYNLYFDPFYLECLFDSPISLNLLITKYMCLINPMVAGLKSTKKLRDIVIKYIEYIIEFDNEEGLMDELLLIILQMLRDFGIKGVNVLARISHKHRKSLDLKSFQFFKMQSFREIELTGDITKKTDLERPCINDDKMLSDDIENLNLEIEDLLMNTVDGSELLSDENKITVKFQVDQLLRSVIKTASGFEFLYDFNPRESHYAPVVSRFLVAVNVDCSSKEMHLNFLVKHLDMLLEYHERHHMSLFPFETPGNNTFHQRVFQSISDIFLCFLIDSSQATYDFLLSYVATHSDSLHKMEVFIYALVDGMIYANARSMKILRFMYEAITNIEVKIHIMNLLVYNLIEFVYSSSDLKSLRAVSSIDQIIKERFLIVCNSSCVTNKDSQECASENIDNNLKYIHKGISCIIEGDKIFSDMIHAILFKLKKSPFGRLYGIVLNLCKNLLSFYASRTRRIFVSLMGNSSNHSEYAKVLFVELEFDFGIFANVDSLPEIDKNILLRVLTHKRFANLPQISDYILRSVDKMDYSSIRKFVCFLKFLQNTDVYASYNSGASVSNIFNNSGKSFTSNIFNDVLVPTKKYIPCIAVLEGFSSLEAKRKFVENISKNPNFQAQNSGSFRVYRNLFNSCKITNSLKNNFIEVYSLQNADSKMLILEILIYCLEYDLPSFDFVMNRLNEHNNVLMKEIRDQVDVFCFSSSVCNSTIGHNKKIVDLFVTIRNRILVQQHHIKENILCYCLEHMHVPVIYKFVDLCIPMTKVVSEYFTLFLNEHLKYSSQAFTHSFAHNFKEQQQKSKAAYNILRYLKRKKCRFDDNKIVLLVYRDLCDTEYEIEGLINWYFKSFTAEDIEFLYRMNNSFMVTSESIVYKMEQIESVQLKNWLIGCFYRQCVANDQNGKADMSEMAEDAIDGNVFMTNCVEFYLKLKTASDGSLDEDVRRRKSFALCEAGADQSDVFPSDCSVAEYECSNSDLQDENSLFYESDESDELVDLFTCDNFAGKNISSKNVQQASSVEMDKVEETPNIRQGKIRGQASKTSKSDASSYNHDSIDYGGRATKKMKLEVKRSSLSFLFTSLPNSILPILELFCDLRIYNKELIELCKNNVSWFIRHASLYYLCLFSPDPTYFEAVFKLSYHERKYALECISLLADRFGLEMFYGTILTVLRSEMRFRTTEFVLVPFLLQRKELVKNGEILHELSIFARRLFLKGHLNYRLLEYINLHLSQLSPIKNSFIVDLNSVVIEKEIVSGNNVLLFDSTIFKESMFDLHRIAIFVSSSAVGCSSTLSTNCKEILCNPRMFSKIQPFLSKEQFRKIFLDTLSITLPREAILFIEIPYELYLGSTLDNQMTVVELILESSKASDGSNPLEISAMNFPTINNLLDSLVASRYPNSSRFFLSFISLTNLFPDEISVFLLNHIFDNEFTYPPLFEALSSIFEKISPEISMKLMARKPLNIPSETFEMNFLHLFRTIPSSINIFKREFFDGLISRNKISRKCFLDLLFTFAPHGIFDVLRFIFLFDFSSIEDEKMEYFIVCLIYNSVGDFLFKKSTGYGSSSSSSSNDYKFDIFYYSSDIQSIIQSLLSDIFRCLDFSSLHSLFHIFNSTPFSLRIRKPFIYSFVSAGFKTNDIFYNPFSPSLKFYEMVDTQLFYGLARAKAGLRETKVIIDFIVNSVNNDKEVISRICELFKKVESRQISYVAEDLNILESVVKRMCMNEGIKFNGILSKPSIPEEDNFCNLKLFNSDLKKSTEIDFIDQRFFSLIDSIENDKSVLDEVKSILEGLSVLAYIPKNSLLFSKFLTYSSIVSEIMESAIILKDNLSDSIYGRFRIWMSRYPSFLASFSEWNLLVKWRSCIFNKALEIVPEHDKRKISNEIGKLNCIYALKSFKEKLFYKSSSILNGINSSAGLIEINQNMQRILLDLECLYKIQDYNTMVSLINSLNITRFSNEDKARLYYWSTKAFKKLGKLQEFDKFNTLSRKLHEIIEHKKEDLAFLRNNTEDNTDSNLINSTYNQYISKLIEIINESSVEDSRPYVVELLQNDQTRLDTVSPQKLYFFVPQIRNPDFLMSKNLLLKSSNNSLEIIHNVISSLCDFSDDAKANSSIARANSASEQENTGDSNDFDSLFESNNITNCNLGSADSKSVENAANRIFYSEIQNSFKVKKSSLFLFEGGSVLPGEFANLKSKYDSVKMMEFIEAFDAKCSTNVFYIRNSDGSLSKITRSENQVHDSPLMQFMELVNSTIKCHSLERLHFDAGFIPVLQQSNYFYSVHSPHDYPIDSFIKLQLYKKNRNCGSLFSEYLENSKKKSKLYSFVESVEKWKDLLKLEILERMADFNDFFVLKRNFINSYSSLICFQYLLGTNSISYRNCFFDAFSGRSYLSLVSSSNIKKNFYLRPNMSSLFGEDGLNGPLCMILKEFSRCFIESDSSEIFERYASLFLRNSIYKDLIKRISPLANENLEDACLGSLFDQSVHAVVNDMVDPKNGLNVYISGDLCDILTFL